MSPDEIRWWTKETTQCWWRIHGLAEFIRHVISIRQQQRLTPMSTYTHRPQGANNRGLHFLKYLLVVIIIQRERSDADKKTCGHRSPQAYSSASLPSTVNTACQKIKKSNLPQQHPNYIALTWAALQQKLYCLAAEDVYRDLLSLNNLWLHDARYKFTEHAVSHICRG